MLYDTHIHSNISSCSRLEIQEILSLAKERGLDGVCITDHQSMDIRNYLSEGIQKNGLHVIFGMEYTTRQGDFLIFGPFEDIAKDLSAGDLLKYVQQNGGVAIAAHPFRENRPVDEKVIRNGLCHVVEGVNGRNAPWENARVDAWRQRYALAESGGSDAHTPEEVGKIATRFLTPVSNRFELIQALKHGLCQPEINSPEALRVVAGGRPLDPALIQAQSCILPPQPLARAASRF